MKKLYTIILAFIMLVCTLVSPAYASCVPQTETPNYNVAFYAYENYHMQNENEKRSGYGYEMMQRISNYLQCTFSYVDYDKTAAQCVELLRSGEIDIYAPAMITPEREKDFTFSKHPAITAMTCLTVKVGNTAIIPQNYTTYNGLRIGLLKSATYNEHFLRWADEKGFSYEVVYYPTQGELSSALINNDVDALLNSYIRAPEDEVIIENFGQTAYYIMTRKENQELIDALDCALDQINLETPNWRSELFNKYYGSPAYNRELTNDEQALLDTMRKNNTVIRGVMDPDNPPYSWYENGKACGIAADIFYATAKKLGLESEIIPVSKRTEYTELLSSGAIDIWIDLDCYYNAEESFEYKITRPYLTTTVSVLRQRSASEKIRSLAIIDDKNISAKEILYENWPEVTIIHAEDTKECVEKVLSGEVDGAILMTYTAQKLAREDIQNRLRVDIVPGASLNLQMAVNARDNHHFYGLWSKTLASVTEQIETEVTQHYIEISAAPSMIAYLFDHPALLLGLAVVAVFIISLILLYFQSVKSRNRQQKISDELTATLKQLEEATKAKQDFFSKMSHDIRTPLNVVLGMTQVAQKYKQNPARLQYALDSISSEGNYLLVLINSILDVNQLEHGYIELLCEPFNLPNCVRHSAEVLRPLADNKSQKMTITCSHEDYIVIGDINRYSQIIINVVSNAIKYTNPGGHIDIQLDCLADNRFRFTCKDNGIGMTEDFIEHITEEYARAEDSRVSKIQGTGLGMSVVKGFVELMNGTLLIESKLGVGSTFTIEIPFAKASPEQWEQLLTPVSSEENPFSDFMGKRVLLVEDNALNAEIARELLQSIGLDVDWAENGLIGLNRFEASTPGEYFAVFMDMQMPVMDGIESTKQIRSSSHPDCNIPILAMTANTFASDRKLCSDAGMNGYISKPIDIEEIIAALQKEIERSNI